MHSADFVNENQGEEIKMEEYIQCFDESGRPTESRSRKLVPGRFLHGVANVAVVSLASEVLCSLRAISPSDVDSGKTQSYLGGGLKPGEDHVTAAVRELFEETGLNVRARELCRIDIGMAATSKRYYQTFVVVVPQRFEPVCKNREIVAFCWLSIAEYWRRVNSDWSAWCGRLKRLHLDRIRDLLAES